MLIDCEADVFVSCIALELELLVDVYLDLAEVLVLSVEEADDEALACEDAVDEVEAADDVVPWCLLFVSDEVEEELLAVEEEFALEVEDAEVDEAAAVPLCFVFAESEEVELAAEADTLEEAVAFDLDEDVDAEADALLLESIAVILQTLSSFTNDFPSEPVTGVIIIVQVFNMGPEELDTD